MTGHITAVGLASLVLRLSLALTFLFHGYIMVDFGATKWHPAYSPTFQAVVAIAHLVFGAALLLGFYSRLAALGIIALMIGALCTETGKLGFAELRLESEKKDEPEDEVQRMGFKSVRPGFEYNINLIAMALAVVIMGSGPLSVDYRLTRRSDAPPAGAQPPAPGG